MLLDMSTRFEHLPNELLLDVFDYVDTRDLCHGFWALNSRFDNLLRSLKNLSLIIEKDETSVTLVFGHQIVRLVVDISDEIDFRQYRNLRSLTLVEPIKIHLERIQTGQIPNLVRLFHGRTDDYVSLRQHAHNVFSNGFPFLCHADFEALSSGITHSWFQSPSIRSVFINCANMNVVPYILSSCPQLYYFQVNIWTNYNTLRIRSPRRDHPLQRFILRNHTDLASVDHIDILLAYMPNVESLTLCFTVEVPFDHVACSIVNRLHRLRRFDCYIGEWRMNRPPIIDFTTSQQMHPCFNRVQCYTFKFWRIYSTGTVKNYRPSFF
jgi:hypothetical protein